jgi:hypothetical protein
LGQTGTLPADARSLHFLASDYYHHLAVSLNGQPLNVSSLQDFGRYQEYGADISSFSGQTVELRFTLPNIIGRSDGVYLDAISFSSTGVPEPSAWALFGLATALYLRVWRRRAR